MQVGLQPPRRFSFAFLVAAAGRDWFTAIDKRMWPSSKSSTNKPLEQLNKYLKDKFIAQMILKIASSITKSCLFLRCKTYILRESSHEQEIWTWLCQLVSEILTVIATILLSISGPISSSWLIENRRENDYTTAQQEHIYMCRTK
jgi:hypothetical protein